MPRSQDIPLSWAQQRLWFLEQLEDLGSTYHMPATMRLRGMVDREALQRSLDAILARHEALRTVFVRNENGEPVQRILPAQPVAPAPETKRPGLPQRVRSARAGGKGNAAWQNLRHVWNVSGACLHPRRVEQIHDTSGDSGDDRFRVSETDGPLSPSMTRSRQKGCRPRMRWPTAFAPLPWPETPIAFRGEPRHRRPPVPEDTRASLH